MRKRWVVSIILCGLIIVACGKLPSGRKAQINVAAPDFLQPIFDRAAAQFYAENGVIVNMKYISQVGFQNQIDSTFDADVLFFLNPERQKYFREDKKFNLSTLSCPFRISMVIANRPDGPSVRHVSDLKKDEFRRIVIINPEPDYEGKLAYTALKKYGIWDALQPKLIKAESGSHLITYLETGEADAAICLEYTLNSFRQTVIRFRFDDFYSDQLNVCGLLAAGDSPRMASAQAFLDFFHSYQNDIYQVPGVVQID